MAASLTSLTAKALVKKGTADAKKELQRRKRNGSSSAAKALDAWSGKAPRSKAAPMSHAPSRRRSTAFTYDDLMRMGPRKAVRKFASLIREHTSASVNQSEDDALHMLDMLDDRLIRSFVNAPSRSTVRAMYLEPGGQWPDYVPGPAPSWAK